MTKFVYKFLISFCFLNFGTIDCNFVSNATFPSECKNLGNYNIECGGTLLDEGTPWQVLDTLRKLKNWVGNDSLILESLTLHGHPKFKTEVPSNADPISKFLQFNLFMKDFSYIDAEAFFGTYETTKILNIHCINICDTFVHKVAQQFTNLISIGYKARRISENILTGLASTLESIEHIIGTQIEEIEDNDFINYTNLHTIKFQDTRTGGSLISDGAFKGVPRGTSIDLSQSIGLMYIPEGPFKSVLQKACTINVRAVNIGNGKPYKRPCKYYNDWICNSPGISPVQIKDYICTENEYETLTDYCISQFPENASNY